MATVVLATAAVADLEDLIATHSLPASTRQRVRSAAAPLASFPLLGPALEGRWQRFRFVLGPWPWMLLVYTYDELLDRVAIVTVQDARSAHAATAERRTALADDEAGEVR